MIMTITTYGDPILKKRGADIAKDYPQLPELVENMYQTMYRANGIGLAAPQVSLSIRMFVVDTTQLEDEKKRKGFKGIKKVFINPQITEESGNEWKYEEGCLSIPGVREDVERKPVIKITYLDEHFVEHKETYDDINARVIQHEYDHIEGILFTDHLKPLKKKLIQKKLENIIKGKVDVDYKVKFYKK